MKHLYYRTSSINTTQMSQPILSMITVELKNLKTGGQKVISRVLSTIVGALHAAQVYDWKCLPLPTVNGFFPLRKPRSTSTGYILIKSIKHA